MPQTVSVWFGFRVVVDDSLPADEFWVGAEGIRCGSLSAMELLEDRDNASAELIDLARIDDRDGFNALAACLMPPIRVAECWNGTRARLGLLPG